MITGVVLHFEEFESPIAFLTSQAQRCGRHLLPDDSTESGRRELEKWQQNKEEVAAFFIANEIAIPLDTVGGKVLCPLDHPAFLLSEKRHETGRWLEISDDEEEDSDLQVEMTEGITRYEVDERRLGKSLRLRNDILKKFKGGGSSRDELTMLAIDSVTGIIESEKGYGVHHIPLARLLKRMDITPGQSVHVSRIVLAYAVNIPGLETAVAGQFMSPTDRNCNALDSALRGYISGISMRDVDDEALIKAAVHLRKQGYYIPVNERILPIEA